MARATAAENVGLSGSKTRLKIAASLVLAWDNCMDISLAVVEPDGEYSTVGNLWGTGKMKGTAFRVGRLSWVFATPRMVGLRHPNRVKL